MTQRKNAHNHSQSAWQRSLPAQSICWLSSFGFLSSGFVVAQTTSGIDNIVPTANSSSRQSDNKATPIIISDAPAPESPKPKVEFSERRAKLKEKLSAKTDDGDKTNTLRTRLKRSSARPVVVKVKKPAASSSPRAVIQKQPTVSLPTASKAPINSPQKQKTILPRTSAVSESKKDYNNALIDPTNYGKKYLAPNSVVITERNSGCRSVVSGGGISGSCAAPSQSQASRKTPAKTTPNWLKESQNATIATVAPASKVKKTTSSPTQVSSKEVTQTVLSSKSVNTYRPSQTVQRVASVTPNLVNNAVRSVTPVAPNNRSVSRVAARSVSKQDYNSNRFIPQPSSFTPQTRVSQEPIAPSGGLLSAPMIANNTAPRPSAVAYNIPLATSLPKVAYSGGAYGGAYSANYNPNGLVFPLSVPSAISSVFGWRQHPLTGNRRFHSGMDLAAAAGTPVLAADSGQVEIADWVGGYGITVVLNHNSAQQTLYGHMSELFVRPGQWVERGTVIGRVGSTGNSTGPHLHFETRQLTPNGWVATNPGTQLQYALNQFLQSLQTAQVVERTNN